MKIPLSSGLFFSLLCCVRCLVALSCSTLVPLGLQPIRLLCPWGFSRQEYWSGLPCPPLVDHPEPGIEPRSPTVQTDSLSLPSEPPGKGCWYLLVRPYSHIPSCFLDGSILSSRTSDFASVNCPLHPQVCGVVNLSFPNILL